MAKVKLRETCACGAGVEFEVDAIKLGDYEEQRGTEEQPFALSEHLLEEFRKGHKHAANRAARTRVRSTGNRETDRGS